MVIRMFSDFNPLESAWRVLPDAMLWVERSTWQVLHANPAACRLLQLDPSSPGMSVLDRFTGSSQAWLTSHRMESAQGQIVESVVVLHDGQRVRAQLVGHELRHLDGTSHQLYLMALQPLTPLIQFEREQGRLESTLNALHRFFERQLTAQSERELLRAACDGITADPRFPLAWIGLVQHDAQHSLVVAAKGGRAIGHLDSLSMRWSDGPESLGLAARAIQLKQVQVENRIQLYASDHSLAASAIDHDLRAVVAIPLIHQGRVLGVMAVYSEQTDAFDPIEISLFEQLGAGVALALSEFQTRQSYLNEAIQRAASSNQLERVLEQMIVTLSGALAERDPYTEGHQRRVAEMSVQIAQHMGLGDERCHVLYLAGIVHDIGKIRVPIGLLTKPTPLRREEMAVIQQHAQATIDILGGVDWPWPLTEIAGQHHERLDGSGYPRGLKGGEILLEARILAVADILESMTSPRPYRPAVGLEAALRVLRQERGTRLDPDVVDAALSLFEEGEST
ncbi:MAG TPA: HD domain-containing phosphohydrolase [Aquabacterium sp.]|nr:HD domain-containing phosphohydrolase [Aquabacterium sp.]